MMPSYWVIAPVESKPPELFDRVWKFDLDTNLISIGWKQLGDVSNMSREQIAEAISREYPNKPNNIQTLWGNMIWAFYHEIKPGDLVIARRGLKTLEAVGEVTGPAFYAPGRSPVHGHPSFIEIAWRDQPRNIKYPTLAFLRPTIVPIDEQKYQRLCQNEVATPDVLPPTDEVEDPTEFALEKYLEDFIVSNFNSIFQGSLKVFEDTEEGEGQQYDTNEVGRIDILATEPSTNSFVVIELKKGRSSDRVIGQTLRYMGWVKKNLCVEGQSVRGLVICRNHNSKLTYALEMTENIDVRYYNISFKLKETPLANTIVTAFSAKWQQCVRPGIAEYRGSKSRRRVCP